MSGGQFYQPNNAAMEEGGASNSNMGFEWASTPQPSSSQQPKQQRLSGSNNNNFQSGLAFDQMGFGGPNGFSYAAGQDADVELEAILSNYQPKVNASSRTPADQLMYDGRRLAPSSMPSTASTAATATADNLDPATAAAAAAAAAYGHLGYGGVGGTVPGRDLANWSAVPLSSSAAPAGAAAQGGGATTSGSNHSGSGHLPYAAAASHPNSSSLRPDTFAAAHLGSSSGHGNSSGGGVGGGVGGASGAGGGYEGDASNSNTSSAHTPGEMSSGAEDSASGKRRRVTLSGGGLDTPIDVASSSRLSPQSMFMQQQQQRFDQSLAAGNLNNVNGQPSVGLRGAPHHRPAMVHQPSSTVDSAHLEELAAAGFRRASEDNQRAILHHPSATMNHHHLQHQLDPSSSVSSSSSTPFFNIGNNVEHSVRPTYRHRRSHSGSMAMGGSSGNTSFFGSTGAGRPAVAPTKRLSHPSSGSSSATPGSGGGPLLGGHAASHPPGLGSQVLRGADGTASGSNAATDFTKRKGWPNRIVEELLDFVHVLDARGRVLFASPSVQTLTGWKSEDLRGREIAEFIHPDDVAVVLRELSRAMQERSELTMYYRFRRKPQSAADKRRIQDQREANANNARSRSGSSSGNDSSSAQSTTTGPAGATVSSTLRNQDEEDDAETNMFRDDWEDKYVIFEATGHPYFPPDGVGPYGGGVTINEEGEEDDAEGGKDIKREFGSPSKLRASIGTGDGGIQDKGGGDSGVDESSSNSEMQCFFCSCRVYPTKNVGMLDSFLELKLENERLRMLLSELSVSETPQHPLRQQHTGGAASSTEAGSEGRRSLDEGAAGYNPDFQSFDMDGTPHFPQHAQMQPSAPNRRDSMAAVPPLASAPTSPIMGQSLERTATKDTAAGEESDDATSPSSGIVGEDGKRKKVSSSTRANILRPNERLLTAYDRKSQSRRKVTTSAPTADGWTPRNGAKVRWDQRRFATRAVCAGLKRSSGVGETPTQSPWQPSRQRARSRPRPPLLGRRSRTSNSRRRMRT